MDIKIQMKPINTIQVRLGVNPSGKAQKFLANTCYKYMAQFVPGGTKSHLNQMARTQDDGVVYQSPGAHYLYTGKKYVDPKYKKGAFYSSDYGYWSRPGITKIPTSQDLKYHIPGTGSYWDKKMWTSKGNEVVKELQSYVDRGCK